jgi:hypothetical protein
MTKETVPFDLPIVEVTSRRAKHSSTHVETSHQIIRSSRSSGRTRNTLAWGILSSAEIAVKEKLRASWDSVHTGSVGAEMLAVCSVPVWAARISSLPATDDVDAPLASSQQLLELTTVPLHRVRFEHTYYFLTTCERTRSVCCWSWIRISHPTPKGNRCAQKH